MRDFLLKVAAVLEKTASVIDASETEKTAAVRTERDAVVKALATKYAEATGEELSADILEKLATDNQVLDTVKKVVEKTASTVERLGHAGENPDSSPPRPRNKKEAAAAAYERFGDFLTKD